MSKSIFENTPFKKPEKQIEDPGQQNYKKETSSENLAKLINLKIGDYFSIPESNSRYKILVKYSNERITAREEGTENIVTFKGEQAIIPLFNKK